MTLFDSKKLIPFIIFLLFGGIALALWNIQLNHERELILRHTETSARQACLRIEGLMNARLSSLKFLADRWVERTPPDFSEKRFLDFAQNLYTHFPGFWSINWIDPEGVVRWVFPEQKDKPAFNRSVEDSGDQAVRETFDAVRRRLAFGMTPCVALGDAGMGFSAFWPLVYDNKVQGYLDGVFQIRRIVETSLTAEFIRDFRVSIFETDRLIFSNENQDRKKQDAGPSVFQTIQFAGKSWRLDLEPRSSRSATAGYRDLPLLIFGLAISAALAFLTSFLFHRMRLYRAARDQALREVAERKKVEQALRWNEEKLSALLAELEEKNSELETFVYTVSHDLKTPIVTIEGFIGAIREDYPDLLKGQGDQYLAYMSDAARKMEALISDLLELSRAGRLKETKSEFPLGELVDEILMALGPEIKARSIAVNVQKDLPLVYGERKRVRQALENMLSNSMKYLGEDNPAPRIDIGTHKTNGRDEFFIRDNGIGIEPEYFEKIFQVFQRLPAAKRIAEGTGVGLAIVKRIVENHGGTIRAESEPGKGATFFFTLAGNDRKGADDHGA